MINKIDKEGIRRVARSRISSFSHFTETFVRLIRIRLAVNPYFSAEPYPQKQFLFVARAFTIPSHPEITPQIVRRDAYFNIYSRILHTK